MTATARRRTPQPIDPRGPRTNQGVLCVGLLAGFVFNLWPVAAVFLVILLLGVVFGPRANPVIRFYSDVVRPRLGPPRHLEDPRPPRFAAAVGVLFLAGATAAFWADLAVLGWALTLIVAGLAGLAAATGICVGCELWLMFAKRRHVELVA